MDAAISVSGLVKRFGRFTALDRLDLKVEVGEVHGFLGPNGSGKSTTIRVLLGLLRADAGQVRVLGRDPWRDAVRLHRHLAYVPGEVSLWPNLTGGEVIDLLARMRGGVDEGRRADLLERFELDPTKQCRSYSKGNRQKVALVAALSADVELLLLDEPTAGLDPIMEAEFQEVAREEVARGRTILLSSHILAEVESLCGRVSIIRDGRTVSAGRLRDLRGLSRTSVTVRLQRQDELGDVPGLRVLDVVDGEIRAEVDSDRIGAVMALFAERGIESLVVHPATLEELFLRNYDDPGGVKHGVPTRPGLPA
ncbi:ABC transporter ATP-binding protein [Nocardioides daeguensis]|uniref:ABC transporter ATP-binding protein n=1 Tax=Nocardioides daeguensis TaxID=908359 RepID=A0ABP6W1C5_9ACTN|nr:ABC transporter ATP-binding protein [Nocardioides daeguensis]MBV6726644.1 ABC transporter ATP-binding protein [Nocardioides daeguensis]MCR1774604.1 ABC transporter ATP-binding protein [Nocardioides daeguensis]